MSWDYIIVGAGSAGCAVASELLRSDRNRVLLLEAGGDNRSPYIRIPALLAKAAEKFDWNYISQPDPTRGNKTDRWTRGRVLGGSSSINGMMFVRGAPHDFDRWAGSGNQEWSYADVVPFFREMESSDQSGRLRGRRGPLHVRTVRGAHPLTDAFIKSATAAGFPFNPDYNGAIQEGVSYAQLSQRRGLRCSSADAFVERLRGRRNFRLLLNSLVHRLHFSKGRVTGLAFTQNGSNRFVSANRVVLCAGAINSPKLLMLSGIGAASELERLGIPAAVDAPQVGQNLQEHPLIRLIYATQIQSNNLSGGLLQKLKMARDFALRRQGPISTTFEAAAFLKTAGSLAHPDIQLHFIPMGIANTSEKKSTFLPYPSVSVYVNCSYPKSRGQVRLASSNPLDAPLIECRLLANPADLEILAHGVDAVRLIMANSPMRGLIQKEITPGTEHFAAEALKHHIIRHAEIAYHPAGTCRMGTDPLAVVTPQLRVNGVENLWIGDASIMPDLISGNTNAVCMMIGMKLGRYLSGRDPDPAEAPSRQLSP